MSIAVFLRASKVVEGKLVSGILLYPTSTGSFKTDEDKAAFCDLFEAEAPPLPYGGVGKRFGPETFALTEVQSAVKEHMKKQFSLPKDETSYWELDGHMHDNLVFDPSVVNGEIDISETPVQAALRCLWEWSGIKADPKELVPAGVITGIHVFHLNISIDRAKYDWITHQAEKRTLTDWDVSPYMDLLSELGIPDVVYRAYCRTHGGPRFVCSAESVKDAFTQSVMEKAGF